MLRIITRETKSKFQVTIGVFWIAFVMSVIEKFTEFLNMLTMQYELRWKLLCGTQNDINIMTSSNIIITLTHVVRNNYIHWGWHLAFEQCAVIARTQRHTDRQRHRANNPAQPAGWYKISPKTLGASVRHFTPYPFNGNCKKCCSLAAGMINYFLTDRHEDRAIKSTAASRVTQDQR